MRTRRHAPAFAPLPAQLRREKTESRSEALLRLLRRIAIAHRAGQTQTFYSRRTIAVHFKLPLSLVSRVFLRLEEEGLLGRIRGSRTVLHGLKPDRRLQVRGVVGLPVSIYRFAMFSDERAFILHLRRQLRKRGFMPAAVFFERHEARGGFLAERLLEAKADTVLWVSPERECGSTVASLQDAGVRVLAAGDCRLSSLPCRYQINRAPAVRAILRDWHQRCAIKDILIVKEPRGHSAANEETYRAAAEEEQFSVETIQIDERSVRGALPELIARKSCGLLFTSSAAALAMMREPDALGELMEKHRVAFVEGAPSNPFAEVADARVDVITLDWKPVAERVVEALVPHGTGDGTQPLVFEAKAHLAVRLEKFCRRL
jgi:hypothetical protein